MNTTFFTSKMLHPDFMLVGRNFSIASTCASDAECKQLEGYFLQAFVENDDEHKVKARDELMKNFADTIHPLIIRITQRLTFRGVYFSWRNVAEKVVKEWSAKLSSTESELNLLHNLLTAWHTYQNGNNLIRSLSVYAENAFSKSFKNFDLLSNMFTNIFVEHFINPSKDRLFKSIMVVMNGGSNKQTVQAVLKLLSCFDTSQTLYYRIFALPYLANLKRLQSSRAEVLSPNNDCSRVISYLKECESIIEGENKIAAEYGFTVQLTRMIAKLLYTQLLETQRKAICSFSVFEVMASLEKSASQQQLGYLYQMLKFDEESLKMLTGNIERFLSNQLKQISLPEYSKHCTSDQVFNFVKDLQKIYQYWLDNDNGMESKCFGKCDQVRQAITSAFASYLNSNSIIWCLLSLYVHLSSMASFSNTKTDCVVDLLLLIEDKQAITECAWYFLCTRMINRLSPEPAKDVAQTSRVLESLQIESPFSGKLILKNFQSSFSFLKEKSLQEKYGQLFQIHLLNGIWKLDNDLTTQTFRLPRSFWAMYNSFRHDFISANPKKILKLNRNYGCSQMLANFASGQRTYQFVVSLCQTVILLLFNKHGTLSFEQIKEKSKLDTGSLLQCIQLFIKYGLLLKTKESDDNVLMESTFQVNDNFSCIKTSSIKLLINKYLQINWIKLQDEFNPSFDLLKIISQCNGDASIEDNPSQKLSTSVEGKISTNSKQSKINGDKSLDKSTPTEANSYMAGGRFRIEAAIIRVLKRATVVADLETLRNLTLEALSLSSWTGQPKSPDKLALSLPLTDMEKCVDLLKKNGYLRRLSTGEIIYEP